NGVGIESRQGGIGATKKEEDCCNSCEEVREAYRAKGWALSDPDSIDQCKREGFLQSIKDEAGEGCNIYGFLDVNKVAGNFHFAPGKSFRESNIHVHDLAAFHKDSFNFDIVFPALPCSLLSLDAMDISGEEHLDI
nr:endoplasmic reticulum-Golgi intermediate compartment protein 3 [Tanacetum cinerariifolium]